MSLDIDDLISEDSSKATQHSPSTAQTEIDSFLFQSKSVYKTPAPNLGKRKSGEPQDESRKASRLSKNLQAAIGCHVCNPANGVTIEEIESRFGPVSNDRPFGGSRKVSKGKAKYPHSPLCIRFMLGRPCNEKKCGYHLEVTPTSISGTAQDYEPLREWFKNNQKYVVPTPAALANPFLFPLGKVC